MRAKKHIAFVLFSLMAAPAVAPPGAEAVPAPDNPAGTEPAGVLSAASDDVDFSNSDVPEAMQTPDAFTFDGTYVSGWSASAASNIALDGSNTFPYLIPDTAPFEDPYCKS